MKKFIIGLALGLACSAAFAENGQIVGGVNDSSSYAIGTTFGDFPRATSGIKIIQGDIVLKAHPVQSLKGWKLGDPLPEGCELTDTAKELLALKKRVERLEAYTFAAMEFSGARTVDEKGRVTGLTLWGDPPGPVGGDVSDVPLTPEGFVK